MKIHLTAALTAALLAAATVTVAAESALRLSTPLLDQRLVVEVRGVPEPHGRDVVEAAFEEARRLARLLDPDGDEEHGLGALNRAAGHGPVALAGELLPLLDRTLDICHWSGAAHGSLGGRLNRLWGLDGAAAEAMPRGPELRDAVVAAGCDRLELDPDAGTATLAEGSRIDLRGFQRGAIVDRAVAALEERGVLNAWVELGDVRRAFGPGLGGGWPLLLPVFPGMSQPLDQVWLRDRALAVVSLGRRPITVAGDDYPPVIDQRTGRPVTGVVGVVVATELAGDAEALAFALFALGSREGQFRAGALRPEPSVLWLLGSGTGTPIVNGHRWSRLRTGS